MVAKLIAVFGVGALVGLVVVGGVFGGGASGAPNATAGTVPNCEFIAGPTTSTTIVETVCAELKVTKVVTGTAPPGTTFPVVVDCQELIEMALPPGNQAPFMQTLTFPEGGGMESIFITEPGAMCTISETPPPGCTLVSINPPTVEIGAAALHTVTVTNNCEVAAEAVAAVPTFTG